MTNNEDTNSNFFHILRGAFIIAIVIVSICWVCSGCNLFRSVDKSSDSKMEEKKGDSGLVRKNEVDTKRDAEYEKTTYIPIIPKGDSLVINNYMPSQPQPRPYIIIQEKGRSSEQIKENNSDSMWNNRMDKLLSVLTEKKTETKGSVLSVWQILGIAFLGIVLIGLLVALVYFKNQITNIHTLLNRKPL